jgi:DNA ligase-1
MLKVLRWIEAEAVVRAYQPGKNGATGLMGALLCDRPDGSQIKVGTGFNEGERGDPPPIGCTITYRYHHKTKTGKPRTAAFVRICPLDV